MKKWQVVRMWEHEIKTGRLSRKLNLINKIAAQNQSAKKPYAG